MKLNRFLLVVPVMLVTVLPAQAQFKDLGYEVGISGGIVQINNESDGAKLSGAVEACVAYPLLDPLQAEFGIGYRELRGKDYHGVVAPVDLRLRFNLLYIPRWIPYVYAGIGLLYFDASNWPESAERGTPHVGWAGLIPFGAAPFGAGVQYRLDEYFSVDVRGAYNLSLSDRVNPVNDGSGDSYLNVLAGLRVSMGSGKKDTDGDSLTNDIEKRIGTDKKNPDTDSDGLSDGEEYLTYQTDPLRADTDGDGLSDGAEVREYRTDPLKDDTDGDGLSDGREVLEYKTSPTNPDTDGDGLDDGQEITEFKTDPTQADSDGDSLSDGDEVKEHKTDPTKADSDGGSVNDAAEIARGSNPRSAADDIPKIAVEIGKPIVLEGIRFKSSSSQILPESEAILNDVFETLRDNTQIVVEIHGYTDNSGTAARNLKLSQERAAAVREWLVAKGISGERLTARGFGAENSIAPNDTAQNRAKNRRIEFVRVK
jgi:outer membrane protein OmpA-like peptidoglycan-associated protein